MKYHLSSEIKSYTSVTFRQTEEGLKKNGKMGRELESEGNSVKPFEKRTLNRNQSQYSLLTARTEGVFLFRTPAANWISLCVYTLLFLSLFVSVIKVGITYCHDCLKNIYSRCFNKSSYFYRVFAICCFRNDLFGPYNYPVKLARQIHFIPILEEETKTYDYRVY